MKHTYLKVFFILAAVALLGSALFFLFRPTPPSLVSSTPNNGGNLDSPSSPILLSFNQKVALTNFRFEMVPSETMTPSINGNTQIVLKFDRVLQINTPYTLTIFYQNKQLSQIKFTTKVPPNTQYDARFLQDFQSGMDSKYPLLAKTPYETADFIAVYSAPLTLSITLKNKTLVPPTAIAQVKLWVTSLGVDAESHTYVIATPSSSPTN